LANVRGQPARVAGLGEPLGSEIFLSGYLASGISNKRLSPEGGRDYLGLSLDREKSAEGMGINCIALFGF